MMALQKEVKTLGKSRATETVRALGGVGGALQMTSHRKCGERHSQRK